MYGHPLTTWRSRSRRSFQKPPTQPVAAGIEGSGREKCSARTPNTARETRALPKNQRLNAPLRCSASFCQKGRNPRNPVPSLVEPGKGLRSEARGERQASASILNLCVDNQVQPAIGFSDADGVPGSGICRLVLQQRGERTSAFHVHLRKGGGEAKFWLRPVALAECVGLKFPEVTRTEALVREREEEILEQWHEHFGQ